MLAVFAVAAALTLQSHSINEVIQKNFDDLSFRAKVVYANQKELAKINKDFGQSYRFDYTDVKLKEPFKLRMESIVEDTNITLIINGARRLIKIPRAKIFSKEDLSGKPGKRQTAFDFGILTPTLFSTDLFDAKFVRVDRSSGEYVFDLTYPARLDDSSRNRIWIDGSKRYITKREWYSQQGKLRATFLYGDAQLLDGVWLPTSCIVKNVDNVRAGETKYERVKMNAGLSDSLFEIN